MWKTPRYYWAASPGMIAAIPHHSKRQCPIIVGERGIQTLSVPSGRVRLQIRLDQCVTWDTTVTIQPADTLTVGFRAPSC